MKINSSTKLIEAAQMPGGLSYDDCLGILADDGSELTACLDAAFYFRKSRFGREVTVHVLNNVQNGLCPEDCRYCAQSRSSEAAIESYSMKPEVEIMAEAAAAFQQGAHRYCLVFSGTGPSDDRIRQISAIVRKIKSNYPIEVCVSPGVVTFAQAAALKSAGLDRLNHNLNTSERHYSRICTTHTYNDRIETLKAARSAGLAVCSGVIVGMGETMADVIDMSLKLREFKAESIPVNFFMPVPGAAITEASGLTPEYCLRVLCLFRLVNPAAEIRMAAGREMHLRALEAMGLYAANSLFLQGYLNVRGCGDARTIQMIKDAGFTIKSEKSMDELLTKASREMNPGSIKSIDELRPFKQ